MSEIGQWTVMPQGSLMARNGNSAAASSRKAKAVIRENVRLVGV